MKKGVCGALRTFDERTGGYENYQYDTRHPEQNNSGRILTLSEANQMLEDLNTFIQKYFPWMKDFVVFQLGDGTVRIDAADRQFLGGDD